jgi:Protein of unknown function (DUF3309)
MVPSDIVASMKKIGRGCPTWPYSAGWGYYPAGGLGLVVIILLILLATRRRRLSSARACSRRVGYVARPTL